jgi:hypothetical protein
MGYVNKIVAEEIITRSVNRKFNILTFAVVLISLFRCKQYKKNLKTVIINSCTNKLWNIFILLYYIMFILWYVPHAPTIHYKIYESFEKKTNKYTVYL